jgi:hypothetical protein
VNHKPSLDLELSGYVQKVLNLPQGGYIGGLRKKDSTISSIRAFTVVQVGWPILVKEVL